MSQWWSGLSGADQVLWGLVVFSTVFFLLQTVMTLIGLGGDGGMDGADSDLDGDGEPHGWGYFSVRNMVAFFLGFSWVALAFRQFGWPVFLAALAGLVAGVLFSATSIYIMNLLAKLKADGTISLSNAVGKEATVSLTVPAERGGRGKVMVEVQGRLAELEAETEGPTLKRNERAYVLRVVDGTTLLIGQ
jgi:hypothetical protein